ncbi:family 10 glycosylhydrolase [Candidatus Bathyarchaeota archaeon]|nr:family 10 glycosylhydrolase [Candidatus Bathyarchaeota archaeon]
MRCIFEGDERWHIHYLCCLNNPSYRSAYQASVREIVKNYDVDAMYFDGPNFYSFCFCKHCKRLFYEKYGFELPVKLSWDDRSMQLFFRQRSEEVEKFFLSLNKEIKAVKDI